MAHPQPYLDNASQPWAKWITGETETNTRDVQRVNDDTSNALKQLNSSITSLNSAVKLLPITEVVSDRTLSIGVNSTYTAKVDIGFTVPAGKKVTRVIVNANAALLDTSTGGVTTAYGRFNFGGILSVEYPAAKDAGASQVNNVISASYGYNVNLIAGSYYNISFELKGLNPTAFPANAQNFVLMTALIYYP